MQRYVSAIAMAVAVVASHKPVTAEKVHTFQTAAFNTSEQAEQVVAELREKYKPAWVYISPDRERFRYLVCLGNYKYLADAWADGYHLDPQIVPDKIIVTLEVPWVQENNLPLNYPINQEGLLPDTGTISPASVESLERNDSAIRHLGFGIAFPEKEPSLNKPAATSTERISARQSQVQAALEDKNPAEAVRKLDLFLESNPDDPMSKVARIAKAHRLMRLKDFEQASSELSNLRVSKDPEEQAAGTYLSGYLEIAQEDSSEALAAFQDLIDKEGAPAWLVRDAKLRRAYLTLKTAGTDTAAPLFRDLANDLDLPRKHRFEAMERYAALAHAREKYATAWVVLKQLEQLSTDPDQVASAKMQRVGLAMELSQREVGDMAEVTALAEEIKATNDLPEQVRATNDLMHAESLFHRGDYNGAIAAAETLIENYPNVKRESNMARVLKGASLVRSGRYQEAKPLLEAVARSEKAQDEKAFGGADARANAFTWLAHSAAKQGDHEGVNAALTDLEDRFPDSVEASKARLLFQNHPVIKQRLQERQENELLSPDDGTSARPSN